MYGKNVNSGLVIMATNIVYMRLLYIY